MNHWKTSASEYPTRRPSSRSPRDFSTARTSNESAKEASAFLDLLAGCLGSITSVFQKPTSTSTKRSGSRRRKGSAIRKSVISHYSLPSLSAADSSVVADIVVDEEEDVLAETELTNSYIAKRRSEKAISPAAGSEYDPRTSSLHESVVHAMNLRPELTDEYDGSNSVVAAVPEEETDEDLTFLTNSSSRKRHSPATASPSSNAYANGYTDHLPAPTETPVEMSPPKAQPSLPETRDDEDYWGDFDVPKDSRNRDFTPGSEIVPEESESGVCLCDECTGSGGYTTRARATNDFGVGLPPVA